MLTEIEFQELRRARLAEDAAIVADYLLHHPRPSSLRRIVRMAKVRSTPRQLMQAVSRRTDIIDVDGEVARCNGQQKKRRSQKRYQHAAHFRPPPRY